MVTDPSSIVSRCLVSFVCGSRRLVKKRRSLYSYDCGVRRQTELVFFTVYLTATGRKPSLSDDLYDPTLSTDSFRRLLKTHLFSEY